MSDKLYYEDKLILNVEDEENGYKRVTLELLEAKENVDGSKDVATKVSLMPWELENCAKQEKNSATDARNYRAIYLVDKIYDLLKEHDVSVDEIGFVVQKMLARLKGVEQQAILNCYGVSDPVDVRIGHWESKL